MPGRGPGAGRTQDLGLKSLGIMEQIGPFVSRIGLEQQGIHNVARAHWNFTRPALYEESIRRGEAHMTKGGTLVALTGAHTGRSPNDKYIVREAGSEKDIWWGKVNRSVEPEVFESIHERMLAYLQGKEIFVQDCFAGADPEYRLPIRVVSEYAWHSLFARNMFIVPEPEQLRDHTPEFTIIQAPGFKARPKTDGTNSETVILMNFAKGWS